MPSKTAIISNGFFLFLGWITAILAVFICLVTAEYQVYGTFSWNYQPEVDLLLSQNATETEIVQAQIRARDVADMRIFSRVILAIVAASFFMALFIWRFNVKDMAAKEKIEIEWKDTRKEIKTITETFGMITELFVFGLVQLTPLESRKAREFVQKFRSNDPQCTSILHQFLSNKDDPDLSGMSLETRSVYAGQQIREILSDYDEVLEGSSLDSETYYSICESSL